MPDFKLFTLEEAERTGALRPSETRLAPTG